MLSKWPALNSLHRLRQPAYRCGLGGVFVCARRLSCCAKSKYSLGRDPSAVESNSAPPFKNISTAHIGFDVSLSNVSPNVLKSSSDSRHPLSNLFKSLSLFAIAASASGTRSSAFNRARTRLAFSSKLAAFAVQNLSNVSATLCSFVSHSGVGRRDLMRRGGFAIAYHQPKIIGRVCARLTIARPGGPN